MTRLLLAIGLLMFIGCVPFTSINVVKAQGSDGPEPTLQLVPQPVLRSQSDADFNSLPTPTPRSTSMSGVETEALVSCSGGFSDGEIDNYLQCYGSPMSGMGSSFETWGRQYNVDPRLMVAIAGAETSFGKHLGCYDANHNVVPNPYNAFNWFYQGCPSPFSSWDEAIRVTTRGVGGSYLQAGQNTIYSFTFGCGSHCYCPNCSNWYNNVRRFYREQGGNPNTNDLTYWGNIGTASVTVNRVWTEDGNGNTKTNFRPGDSIIYRAEKHNSGSSTVSAYFEWQVTGPRRLISWSGNLPIPSGNSIWRIRTQVLSDAPSGTYTFQVSSNYNGQTSSKSTTFTVSGGGTSDCPKGQFRAEYYNNRSLNGSPVFAGCEGTIDNEWYSSGPGHGVNNDNFSVRWKGRFDFDGGNYTFIARTDDGMKVWIDDNKILDKWRDQAPTEYKTTRTLSRGEHEIKVEYYEHWGWAVAQLRWERADTVCHNQYRAEYYNNRYLSGSPTFTQCENWPINHNWGSGGPGRGVGNDNFSVRWTGRAHISEGTYDFTARTDDGMKVWIGDDLIIEEWDDQAPTEYRVTRHISGGDYDIKVEYYEHWGGAVARFRWDQASSGGGNLALNKDTWATSQESGYYAPFKATDGRRDTRWSSWISSSLGWQWLKVDLGSAQTFNRFVVRWEDAYAAEYWIAWCDSNCIDGSNSNWRGYRRTLSSRRDEVIDFSSRTHRYVGVLMTKRAPRMNNYSIWEFEVYNRSAATNSAAKTLQEIPLEPGRLPALPEKEEELIIPSLLLPPDMR